MDKEALKQRIAGDPEDFSLYLSELLESGRIEDPAAIGVSKKVIAEKEVNLSKSQWYALLDKGLMKDNYVENCELCFSTIPWSEMIGAVDIFEDGYCSYCRHMTDKLERS